MIGQTLGSYSIQRELGKGGMGAVYVGVHGLLGRTAAVKVLHPELSRNQEIVQRFFNEARAATAIKHPGIVEIYDFGFAQDGSAYIVMEYLEGESLSSRLKRFGRLAPVVALGLVRQVAGALAAAHKAGIVHRDLKPDNVFVVPDAETAIGERVKLLDFGIAKLAGDGAASMARTSTGAIMGTPYYMSPEQCKGAGQVDARSDLYSLGCMLFEMVCGRVPFVGEGAGEIIAAHIHVPPPSAREVAPDVPVEVEGLIARLLAKRPEDRPQSADQLVQWISDVMSRLGAATTSPNLATSLPATPVSTLGHATTLGAAAGASQTRMPAQEKEKRSRLPLRWIGGGVALTGVIIVVIVVVVQGGGASPHAAATPDARAAVAAVLDAAPTPPPPTDHARLLDLAKQAVAGEDWDAASSMSRALLGLDPDDPDGQKIAAQAALEGPAKKALATIAAAQTDKSYDAALAAYPTIPDTSQYHAQASAIIPVLEKQDLAEASDKLDAKVKDHACADARRIAGDETRRWHDAAAALSRAAKSCKDAVASTQPPTSPIAPSNPPPSAAGPPPADIPTLMNDGKNAAFSGQYAAALADFEKVLEQDPTNRNARFNAATVEVQLGDCGAALRYLKGMSGPKVKLLRDKCAAPAPKY